MKWFRAHRRSGSWLALVALAIQFGLAFGHVHAGARRASGDLAGFAALHPDRPAAILDQASDRDRPGHEQDRAGTPCEICAITAMAHAALIAAPPALSLPQQFDRRTLAGLAAPSRPGDPRAAFQARAPPLS